MGLLALFFGDSIAMMFSRDTAVIEQAYLYLKAYAPECVLMPFLFCFLGYFNGCEKTMFVMIQGLIGAFLVRIPIVLLVSRLEGTTLFHIGLSTPAASLVQSVIAVVFFLHLHRQGRRSERYILRGEHMN